MKYVIGNWKMNPLTLDEALSLAQGISKEAVTSKGVKLVVCPPFLYLKPVYAELKGVDLGAQDVSVFEKGAYTGQVSASQLKDLWVKYVIVGHSERRAYAKETNADVAAKIKACVSRNLTPILCVGAGLASNDGEAKIRSVVREQVTSAITGANINDLIIAYEPTWAIGTGIIPESKHVADITGFIRGLVEGDQAKHLAVIYGGRVNSKNISSFHGVDGFLPGGASLDADEFDAIVKATDLLGK